jgi:Copper binding periplasmic protein CusF
MSRDDETELPSAHCMRIPLMLLVLLGCGSGTYTGVGDIVAIEPDAARVTINHEDIPGLMGAMTMTFPVRSPDVLTNITVGTDVRFELERDGTTLILIRVTPAAGIASGRPGIHDHTPHHGGVVTMIGMLHLEARATRDGRVRVYLSDVWRRPLPIVGVTGAVTIDAPEGRRELTLAPGDDGDLEATFTPGRGDDVNARVRLVREGTPIEAAFMLPLDRTTTGAAGVPLEGCQPPAESPPPGVRAPRCVLRFSGPVTALAATPDGAVALISTLGGGVTAWHLPAGAFAIGFAPPPPRAVPPDALPHPESANAISISPDARDAAIAIENRLLVYELSSGLVVRELPPFGGVVRSVAWSPDGRTVLASVFYDASAHLLDARDGHELRLLPVEREGAALAFRSDGRSAAVGSGVGTVSLFDLTTAATQRSMAVSRRPIEAVAFAGDDVAVPVDAGVGVWDPDRGAVDALSEPSSASFRLTVAPGGRLVASAGLDHRIRIYDLRSRVLLETIDWHRGAVIGIAWAGSMLVSADWEGRVALWDLADRSD